jgi:ribose/xylose/arabinose/galactoside ABC-type transport system permease subunit
MENKLKSFFTRIPQQSLFLPLIILALLLAFNAIFTPHFFNVEIKDGKFFGSLIDIVRNAAPLMLLAIGMTLVVATHGIDLSVSSVLAIAGAMAALLLVGPHVLMNQIEGDVLFLPMPLAILGALVLAAICGAWNGMLVSRVGLQPIIATLILYVSGRGIAQLITSGQIITIYYKPYFFIGNGWVLGLPFSIFIAGAVFAGAVLLTRLTALGLYIESIGINPTAAHYSGIKTKNIIFWVYVFCGLCAGIAGLIVSSNVKSADGNNMGRLIELDAILAVVLGGTSLSGGRFFLAGSLVGALIIQALTTTIYAVGVPPEVTYVVKAGVVFIVCLIQSATLRKSIVKLFRFIFIRRPAQGGQGSAS